MKKYILLFFAISIAIFNVSCSSSSDDEILPPNNDFTNPNYIKSIMIGEWKLKSHNSGSFWSDTPYDSYYIFNSDNTYTYKSVIDVEISPLENGTYFIVPATSDLNAKLILKYTYSGRNIERSLTLINLNKTIVEVYNSGMSYKYEKQ